jgi:ABC-type lipoprotein release transport system permease subunit
MALPVSYNLLNLRVRSTSTVLAVVGIAIVVVVFNLILALADGFQKVLATTGSDRNALLLRAGSTAELNSGISREQARLVAARAEAYAEASKDGTPLVSPELLVIVNHPRRGRPDELVNLNVRGVSPLVSEVRPNLRLVQGRWFEPGKGELVAGVSVSRGLADCGLGETLRMAQRDWKIVGVASADGGSFESELIGDADELGNAFNREGYQSVTVRLRQLGDIEPFEAELAKEQTLQVDVHREKQFYIDLAGPNRQFFLIIGILVCAIMSIGAMAGALNTMNASVVTRIREIGTLRALGFSRMAILVSFLFELLVLSLIGGVLGCVLSLIFDGWQASMVNFTTFSDLSFALHVDKVRHFAIAIGFALVMGVFGGLIPAVRGSTLKITTALRQI